MSDERQRPLFDDVDPKPLFEQCPDCGSLKLKRGSCANCEAREDEADGDET